jgi:hypothetical protein
MGAAALSPAAFAHGGTDWLHGTLDGVVQFFTALESVLPVLLVALLARRHGLRFVTIHAAALAIGLLIALLSFPETKDSLADGLYARGYLIALGLVVLFNLRLHDGLVLVLVLAAGTLTGLEARSALLGDPTTGFGPVAGFVFSAICFYLPATLLASLYSRGWPRIAMRVVASWIAAIAAMDMTFMIVRPG